MGEVVKEVGRDDDQGIVKDWVVRGWLGNVSELKWIMRLFRTDKKKSYEEGFDNEL